MTPTASLQRNATDVARCFWLTAAATAALVIPELAMAQPASLPLPSGVTAGDADAVPKTAVEGTRFILKLVLTVVAIAAIIIVSVVIMNSIRNADRTENGLGQAIPAIGFGVLTLLVVGGLVTLGWTTIENMAITY